MLKVPYRDTWFSRCCRFPLAVASEPMAYEAPPERIQAGSVMRCRLASLKQLLTKEWRQ